MDTFSRIKSVTQVLHTSKRLAATQFRRVGPTTVALLHKEPQSSLATFAIITSMKSEAHLFPAFNNQP